EIAGATGCRLPRWIVVAGAEGLFLRGALTGGPDRYVQDAHRVVGRRLRGRRGRITHDVHALGDLAPDPRNPLGIEHPAIAHPPAATRGGSPRRRVALGPRRADEFVRGDQRAGFIKVLLALLQGLFLGDLGIWPPRRAPRPLG